MIDDEALIRSGFRLILNAAPDIEVVAAVGGGQALEAVSSHSPDLVLLDIRMPDVDGLTVLAALMDLPHRPKVAMLTTFDMDDYVARAFGLGACGYLLKDTDPDCLAPAVRSHDEGTFALAPKVASVLVDGYLHGHRTRTSAEEHGSVLNAGERKVLMLLAEGLSNSEIGVRLHLSESSIKARVSAALAKLAVGNRVQAALWAQRAGLLADSAARWNQADTAAGLRATLRGRWRPGASGGRPRPQRPARRAARSGSRGRPPEA
ncbi:response regulator [Kitasatospora purpeofusca]|uniref:response regulator n=1 Tax=Kitasatospora purpeofusca TaxID=67352 RepID=UPI00364D61B3